MSRVLSLLLICSLTLPVRMVAASAPMETRDVWEKSMSKDEIRRLKKDTGVRIRLRTGKVIEGQVAEVTEHGLSAFVEPDESGSRTDPAGLKVKRQFDFDDITSIHLASQPPLRDYLRGLPSGIGVRLLLNTGEQLEGSLADVDESKFGLFVEPDENSEVDKDRQDLKEKRWLDFDEVLQVERKDREATKITKYIFWVAMASVAVLIVSLARN